MPQLDSDAFTYSNGLLATASSGKWTKLSSYTDLSVVSNQAKCATGGADCIDVISSWSGGNDQYSQCVMATAGNNGGPSVRSNTSNTLYLLIVNSTTWRTYKIVSGSATQLSSTSQTTVDSDTLYLEVQGDTLISKINGTQVNSVAGGSAIASGSPGLYVSDTTVIMDNWAAGNFGRASKNTHSWTLGMAIGMDVGVGGVCS